MAEVILRVVGEEAEVHGDARHHAAAVAADERAVVASLDPGQVLDPGLDAIGDPTEDLRALLHRQRRPPREGRLSCCDGGVDLCGPAEADLGQRLLIDRGDGREGRDGTLRSGGGQSHAAAADPVASVDSHPLDLRDEAVLERSCRGVIRGVLGHGTFSGCGPTR